MIIDLLCPLCINDTSQQDTNDIKIGLTILIIDPEFCFETKLSVKSRDYSDLFQHSRSSSALQGSLVPAQLGWFDADGGMVGILEITFSHVDPLEPLFVFLKIGIHFWL
jgi:hypothetical protein